MKLIRYHHPSNHSVKELFDWDRDPIADFEPLSRFLSHRFRDATSGDSRLAVDLFDAGDQYGARFHLPGVAKEDVRVSLDPNSELVVSLEPKRGGDENSLVAPASRRVPLPDDANADAVTAKLEDGVLTVTVGKTEAAKPRSIEIH